MATLVALGSVVLLVGCAPAAPTLVSSSGSSQPTAGAAQPPAGPPTAIPVSSTQPTPTRAAAAPPAETAAPTTNQAPAPVAATGPQIVANATPGAAFHVRGSQWPVGARVLITVAPPNVGANNWQAEAVADRDGRFTATLLWNRYVSEAFAAHPNDLLVFATTVDGYVKAIAPFFGPVAAKPAGPDRVASAPSPVPAQPSAGEAALDPSVPLPVGARLIHRASAGDLDGDGKQEMVVIAGFEPSPEGISYHHLELFVHVWGKAGWELAWRSGPLIGERAEMPRIEDINRDGRPEVLSVQSMGASGQTMYVFAWLGDRYGTLQPKGGHFDGGASFGEKSVRLADVDDDGVPEILAGYGPVSSSTAIYRWNGQEYEHLRTEQVA